MKIGKSYFSFAESLPLSHEAQFTNHLEKPYVRMSELTSVIKLDFEFIIKNGRVIDGSGNPWFKADISISEGKIAKVSTVPLKEERQGH